MARKKKTINPDDITYTIAEYLDEAVIEGCLSRKVAEDYLALAKIYKVDGIIGNDLQLGTILYILRDYTTLAKEAESILQGLTGASGTAEAEEDEDWFDDVPLA